MMKDKAPDKRIVYIKSGVDVDYGRVVEAIDTIRKQDIDKIGLGRRQKKGRRRIRRLNLSRITI
jgi:biopolymer transport protein ExbD